MSFTVQQLHDQTKGQAGTAGVCDPDEFMARLNNVGPELINMITARGMGWTWCLCVCGGCVTLPSQIHSVQKAWFDGYALDFRSEWFHGRLGADLATDSCMSFPWESVIHTGQRMATRRAVVGCENDVFYVVARHRSDAGKKVEIRYRMPSGREKVHEFTLAMDGKPSKTSNSPIGELTRFYKPRTSGAIELWVKDLAENKKRLISVYDAREEILDIWTHGYEVIELTAMRSRNGRLILKGKSNWLPLRDMNDIVPFGSVMAWRPALKAEAASAAGDIAEKELQLADAVNMLDREIRGRTPAAQAQTVRILSPWTIINQLSPVP